MSEITIKDIQKRELDIMVYIDHICRENNIQYYLAFGSALGAVRHKGFIPWDDDMDVIMPRPDYERFVEVIINDKESQYRLDAVETNKTCVLPLAKVIDTKTELVQSGRRDYAVIGIWVDILILDGIDKQDAKFERWIKKQQFKSWLWNRCAYTPKPVARGRHYLKRVIFKMAIDLAYAFIGTRRLAESICKNAKKYKYEDCQTVGVCGWTAGDAWEHYVTTKDILGEGIEVPFEDHSFFIPTQYDKYLRDIYGDYMTPPPESKRNANHKYSIKFLD